MTGRRFAVLAGTLAVLATTASPAWAGDPFYAPNGYRLEPGTTRYDTALQGARTSSLVYGAVGAFDREIRPLAEDRDHDGGAVFRLEYNFMPGAVHAIGPCKTRQAESLDGCARGYSLNKVDYNTSSFVIGGGSKYFGAFYAASIAMPTVPGTGLDGAVISELIGVFGPIMGYASAPVRAFGQKAYDSVFPWGGSADAVVGIWAGPDQAKVYAGYVLSQGLFGDLSIPAIRGFSTAVLAHEFKELALFKAGIRAFDYLGDNDLVDTIGRTSLYGRQLVYDAPKQAAADATDFSKSDATNAVKLLTAHFEQQDIAEWVSVSAAYAFKPKAFLHEARASVHTPRFDAMRSAPTFDKRKEGGDIPFGVSIGAGVVQLLNLWYYGVEGGRRLSVSAEANLGNLFRFALKRNDPEILSSFPFAYDVWSIDFSLGARYVK